MRTLVIFSERCCINFIEAKLFKVKLSPTCLAFLLTVTVLSKIEKFLSIYAKEKIEVRFNPLQAKMTKIKNK